MAAPIGAGVPQSKLIFEVSNFACKKSKHIQVIEDHFFNHAIDIFIPSTSSCPATIEQELVQQKFYHLHDVPLSQLIGKEFIDGFLKKGSIYMLSYGTHIDTENCVALTPHGDLILNIDKDTYEQLGLVGSPSTYNGKKVKTKFVVTIELTKPCFQPGKKNYERVKWCLTDRLDLRFDFLATWVPDDDAICPSSIAAYFQRLGIKFTQCKLKREFRSLNSIQAPLICSTDVKGMEQSCSHSECFEWLGAMACNIDSLQSTADSYVSTYSCPEPSQSVEHCVSCRYRGFIAPGSIVSILQTLRSSLQSTTCPWASLTVHGYSDTPVSWHNREHGYNISGDNLYTFLIFPNGDYWLFKAMAANDVIF